jgi:hypothetical protein
MFFKIVSKGRKKDQKPPKTTKPQAFLIEVSLLWYQLESNQRHKDFQSFALPTELWYPFPLGTAKVISFFVSENIF